MSTTTYRVGDRVHKAGNPARTGAITDVFRGIYTVRWDRWYHRILCILPCYFIDELEASR